MINIMISVICFRDRFRLLINQSIAAAVCDDENIDDDVAEDDYCDRFCFCLCL